MSENEEALIMKHATDGQNGYWAMSS